MEFERWIPSGYKNLELKEFCRYNQKDYEIALLPNVKRRSYLIVMDDQSWLWMVRAVIVTLTIIGYNNNYIC
jgi:hypothetical protein